jgi:hypothetical protein
MGTEPGKLERPTSSCGHRIRQTEAMNSDNASKTITEKMDTKKEEETYCTLGTGGIKRDITDNTTTPLSEGDTNTISVQSDNIIPSKLSNFNCSVQVDSGAEHSILHFDVLTQAFGVQPTNIKSSTIGSVIVANSSKIPVLGRIELNIRVENEPYIVGFQAVKTLEYQAVLGHDFCQKYCPMLDMLDVGLDNRSAIFQGGMSLLLKGREQISSTYLDDVLICSLTFERHHSDRESIVKTAW